ncbi:MAG: phosphohydrolase, partial [Gemmatimonadetes bacterium]|nr:phosphohydrolase [Gemmatimonadota bacterium]
MAETPTHLHEELEHARAQLQELNKIGMALMSERDPEKLLGLILTQARRLSGSDAGSLYLVETDKDGTERLHFLRSQNDTLPHLPSPDFTLPLDDDSIAGYVALTGKTLVLADV